MMATSLSIYLLFLLRKIQFGGAHDRNVWDSKTGGKGSKPHMLIMQDDGNLVLYDVNSQVHWPSGTGRN